MDTCEFLVVGSGIIGLEIAIELKRRFPSAGVILLDKEPHLGAHASGRNSGVLHAGFYYTADSLKARFCREGNRILTQYCKERGLALRDCGKLVVAKDASELEMLDLLHKRGLGNDVPLEMITAAEARKMEPNVNTFERALFSPITSTVDPIEILRSRREDALALGIDIRMETRYLSRSGRQIRTTKGNIEAGFVVNCAGLYADDVARDFGFSENYRILPFKGLYLYANDTSGPFRMHIYPVPDIQYPFLGVHVTVAVDGRSKIGPTAIPAFWREQYTGLANFNVRECAEILFRQLGLMLSSSFDFKKLAFTELRKYNRRHLVRLAKHLGAGIDEARFLKWGKPGIRAQLIHRKTGALEMDFVIEGDDRSIHVLNAVSPAFTCSQPFASHVVDRIQTQTK